MYLLKRKLRHLNAISVYNVSIVRDPATSEDVVRTIPNIFVVIEDMKETCLYASEIQPGSRFCTQFNEMPHLPYTLSKIRLKIIGQVPETLLRQTQDPVWTLLASYVLDFAHLSPVLAADATQSPKHGINVPVLHFADGSFSIQGEFVQGQSTTNLVGERYVKSFSFNGALKLNKLMEYCTQLQADLDELSHKIDTAVIELPKPIQKGFLISAQKQLESEVRSRKEKAKLLEAMCAAEPFSLPESTEETRTKEEYGSIYSEYTNILHDLRLFEAQKIGQLLVALYKTGLCAPDGFITPHSKGESVYNIQLKKVDSSAILNRADRLSSNTLLGYYLLFVQVLASRILYLPLPHHLSFYGSTSVIDNKLPLYLNMSSTQQHISDFERALDCFNLDVMQVSQFLERHR
ncbi:LADA_0H08218g1_1 [Lachancea dasiensis]|uniref:LADA_0H08218g1_1 n=1 Tax=Lachancea dasiensis TaxID=1072105 RepID=A0A1G4K2D7_9SACH|nr:LADA_0H08218g1_1 [Lachancea dasiensis]